MAVDPRKFLAFTEQFEGHTDWFYLDVKGLVSIGYGNLADPLSLVRGLDFRRADGFPATASEVSAAWLIVKGHQELSRHGGGAFEHLTEIRATEGSILALVGLKMSAFERDLRTYFPDYDTWPEDAQLGTLSMAWAMGSHFPLSWPKFSAACRAQDWVAAAENCKMSETNQNESFRRRNLANRALFESAVT